MKDNEPKTDRRSEAIADDQQDKMVKVKSSDIVQSKTKRKNRKKPLWIALIAFIAVIALFSVWYWLLRDKGASFYAYKPGEVMTNGKINVVVGSVEPVTELYNFTFDENYTYYAIKYTITNITGEDLEWKEFYPYASVNELREEDKSFAWFHDVKTALKVAGDTEQQFDVDALRMYGIVNGIDFTGIKDDLPPEGVLEDVDIVKILKMDDQSKMFFITFDNLKAIVPVNASAIEAASRYAPESGDQTHQDEEQDTENNEEQQ